MRIKVLLLILMSASGCASLESDIYVNGKKFSARPYLPGPSTEFREHVLGMRVYNKTSMAVSEQQWADWFSTVESAYAPFKRCVGIEGGQADEELRRRNVVVFAEHFPWPHHGIRAFTNAFFLLFGFLPYESGDVFISKDYFIAGNLRHEWIHVYMGFLQPWRRYNHNDPLFQKCEH